MKTWKWLSFVATGAMLMQFQSCAVEAANVLADEVLQRSLDVIAYNLTSQIG